MEHIWFKDIRGFMTENNFLTFFPASDMSFSEQLNAIMRFAIYLSIVVYIIKHDTKIFFAPILMGILTYMMYTVDVKNKYNDKQVMETMGMRHDPIRREYCQKPTRDNPFMNVLISDIKDNPNRPRACRLDGKTKKEAKKYFDVNLYRDVDDVFQKKASDRQYYTMPSTTIPNNAGDFAKWLYGTPGKTCKEGNGSSCYVNLHNNHIS